MKKFENQDSVINEWRQFYVKLDAVASYIKRDSVNEALDLLHNQIKNIDTFYTNFGRKIKEERQNLMEKICKKKNVDWFGNSLSAKRKIKKEESPIFNYKKFIGYYSTHSQKNTLVQLLESFSKLIQFKKFNIKNIVRFAEQYEHKNKYLMTRILKELYQTNFFESDDIERKFKETNKFYNKVFLKNKKKLELVENRLRFGSEESGSAWFISGLFFALNFYFFYAIFTSGIKSFSKLAIAIYLLYFYFFSFGLSLKIFQKTGINYTLIFNLNPISSFDISRYHLTIALYIFFLFLLPYYFTLMPPVSPLLPLSIYYLCLLIIIFIPIFHWRSRFRFLSIIGKTFTIWKFNVEFSNFFVADFLISMVPIFSLIFDIFFIKKMRTAYLLCIYIFPCTLRIIQCTCRYFYAKNIINLYNIGKYCINIFAFIVVKGKFFNSLINFLIYIFSNLISFYWDITYDWVLNKSHSIFTKGTHNIAVLTNLIFRLIPILTIFDENNDMLIYAIFFCEAIRRSIWAVFRIESEHLNNCNMLKVTSLLHKNIDDDLFYKPDESNRKKGDDEELETIDLTDVQSISTADE